MFEKIKNDISNYINSSDLDLQKINLNGATIRLGGKVMRLVVDTSVDTNDIEKEIRSELEAKLKSKLVELSSFINSKMNESLSMVESLKSEFQRKEKLLNDQLVNSHPMPSLALDHIRRGLSVVPAGSDGIGWLVRKTYWPKFIDDSMIDIKTQKKMITNVIVYITSKNEIVREISIRNFHNFDTFDHYHRNCWGNWDWSKRRITNPDDAIKIADDAIAVLEKINSMSIAKRNPVGLPRLDTIRRNTVVPTTNNIESIHEMNVSPSLARTGVDPLNTEDVWTSSI